MSSSGTTEEAPEERSAVPARGSWQPALLLVGGLLALLLVAAGALGLSGAFSSGPTTSGTQRNSLDGTRLPTAFDPALARLGGNGELPTPWSRGHPGVLLFFAKWCGPCHRELPRLAPVIGSGVLGGVDVVGVDEDTPGAAAAFVRAEDVRFPVGIDAGEAFASIYVPEGLPSTIFVNAHGVVVDVHYGVLSPAQLQAGLDRLRGSVAGRRVPSRG